MARKKGDPIDDILALRKNGKDDDGDDDDDGTIEIKYYPAVTEHGVPFSERRLGGIFSIVKVPSTVHDLVYTNTEADNKLASGEIRFD